jgi:hypothetical protein
VEWFNGPAQDIGDYDDGAQVVQHYLAHEAARTAPPLTSYLAESDIAELVDDENRTWGMLRTSTYRARSRCVQPRWRSGNPIRRPGTGLPGS